MHGRKSSSIKRDSARSPSAGTTDQAPSPSCPPYLTPQPDGVTLAIKVQPRASRNEIKDVGGPELRVKVTAPPVDSAANEAVLRLLADVLGCPRRNIELVRGHTSRNKLITIHGVSPETVLGKLV